MCVAPGFGKAHGAKDCVVFGQFNPGFQFQRGQVQGQRAGFGKVDQRPRMALAALIGSGMEFIGHSGVVLRDKVN